MAAVKTLVKETNIEKAINTIKEMADDLHEIGDQEYAGRLYEVHAILTKENNEKFPQRK